MDTQVSADPLVCPLTKQPLFRVSAEALEESWGEAAPRPRTGSPNEAIGLTEQVLVRADGTGAFPVLDSIPVLLGPEMLVRPATEEVVDLTAPTYHEAYSEMDFYNSGAVEDLTAASVVDSLQGTPPHSFPVDWSRWLDARYDCRAQDDCYLHLGPMSGRTALQLGGAGLHAVKFLLAGARRAFVVTPMVVEARRAIWLAKRAGVEERLVVVLGIAEELPFEDESVDAIFSGGCVHHMVMEAAMPEIERILAEGAPFAAAEPWRAPFYALGTRILGKREANAYCVPLSRERAEMFGRVFSSARVTHHGTLLRYLFLALSKFGLVLPLRFIYRAFGFDDAAAGALGLRRYGSSVALTAQKHVTCPPGAGDG